MMIFVSDFYKKIFKCKTYKISLDASCTCPNRDGTKGEGGCIFCSANGSGDFVPLKNKTIEQQVIDAKKIISKKIKNKTQIKYIAYFQNFSSTYGNSDELILKYEQAIAQKDIVGIAIATRVDCLSDKILKFLAELSKTTYVQLELGLQTSNESTGKLINRCYTNDDYINAIKKIKSYSKNIHIVTHLIFGLVNETKDDMIKSVKFVIENNNYIEDWGIKITVLYVLKETPLAKMYKEGQFKTLEKEEYFALLKDALAILPNNCIIHRFTGDPPKSQLIAPLWTTDKKRVLSEIKELE